MTGSNEQVLRKFGIIPAAVGGAFLALVVAYLCSYVLTRYGLGIVGGRGDRVFGPVVFARSALNLYALHHVTLEGAGEVVDPMGNRANVMASITLPLTIWACVPAIALIIGGRRSAKWVASSGRRAMMSAAVLSGLIYGIVLTIAAHWIGASLDTFLIPEIGGLSANPPQITFRPSLWSSLVFGVGFGVAFCYLGGLIASRRMVSESHSGVWWACSKAVLITAVAVQIVIACVVLVFVQARGKIGSESANPRLVEMLPTAAGLGYSMIHGATLISSVESKIVSQKITRQAFYVEFNAYRGTKRDSAHKPPTPAIWISGLVIGVVAAFVLGRLAARYGSRDGSLPTACRTAVLHTAYVALMPMLCNMALRQSDALSCTVLYVGASLGKAIFISFVVVLVFSLIGAHTAGRGRRGEFTL